MQIKDENFILVTLYVDITSRWVVKMTADYTT